MTDDRQTEEYRSRLRHSAAHVLAEAVIELYPEAKLTIGPPIKNGFYYDFDLPQALSDNDLQKIEAVMLRVVEADTPFVEREIDRQEAVRMVSGNPYKKEILELIPADQKITVVSHSDGAFTDLCQGGHVNRTGEIKAFKLLKTAGAYWRGDENRPMLQRVYGTAWELPIKQKEHLEMLALAEQLDHRRIGQQQQLFFFSHYAPASPFFLPKGTLVLNTIADYIRQLYTHKYGYQEVITPQIFNVDMWKRSGHYQNYAENMYFIKTDEREYALKPMNCPAAALIYKSSLRSYRELPLRLADFGRLHRYERSGVLHGLTRVRSFSQDDAHIFCTEEQVADEVRACLEMLNEVYATFGFSAVEYTLSLRPSKRVGDDAMWDRAEQVLLEVLKSGSEEFREVAGEGAFYGPKIDVFVSDALGRQWQLGTVQLDFSLPAKFELEYVAGTTIKRPVVVHRTVIGSQERFLGVLLEHLEGKLPVWLAPVQVVLIPIADRHHGYATDVANRLRQAGLRCETDMSNERMNNKVRKAQQAYIPIMAIVGDREQKAEAVAVRLRDGGDRGAMPVVEFVQKLTAATKARQDFG